MSARGGADGELAAAVSALAAARTRKQIDAVLDAAARRLTGDARLRALADAAAVATEVLLQRADNARLHAELDARSRAAAEIVREARTDELTGIFNRRGFFHGAQLQLDAARGNGGGAVVGFFDVDRLKAVNDSLGHAAGSKLIVEVAEILMDAYARIGVVGRLGGDEFAVLLPRCGESEEQLRRRLAAARAERNPALALSAGFVRSEPGDERGLGQLIEAADAAMYAEKRAVS